VYISECQTGTLGGRGIWYFFSGCPDVSISVMALYCYMQCDSTGAKKKYFLSLFTQLFKLYRVECKYCDMTPESRNSGAGARRPLLSNGSEITLSLKCIVSLPR
jgi:hypothetical protein